MKAKPHEIAIAIKGGITIGHDPATGKPVKVVYQRVGKGKGNIQAPGRHDLQVRRQAAITDKKSPAQLRGRARIAAAVAAWHALDEAGREACRRDAERLHMTGFNLHVRRYCEAHPLTEL